MSLFVAITIWLINSSIMAAARASLCFQNSYNNAQTNNRFPEIVIALADMVVCRHIPGITA